jgi:PAS domain S-box-containing protein
MDWNLPSRQASGKYSNVISRVSGEKWFRALVENSLDTVALIAPDGTILYQSPSVRHILGYADQELIGRQIFELLHPDDALRVINLFSRLLDAPESSIRAEFRYRHKNGSYRWIESVGSNFLAEPSVQAIVANYRDITERKEAEKALRHLAAIVQSSDDAIISRTLDGILTSWNPGAERLYGYRAHEVIGQHVSLLLPPEQLAELLEMDERIKRGERIIHYETVRLTKDQRPIHVAITVSPIRNAAGALTGVSTIARDITERKKAEAQALELAVEKERARMLADFVRNASHDFRTPLSTINTCLYLLEHTDDPSKRRERIQVIAQQSERLAKLVEGLLTMTRLDYAPELALHPLDLNGLVQQIALKLRPLSKRVLILNLANDNLPIEADEMEMGRALTEVVANAVQYTPDGGQITVRTYRQNHHVVAEVQDTGIGIAEEDLPHIFERLYRADKARTTQTGGVGLGLSIARKIVEAHGGTIEAASVLGEGSIFKIALPRLDA